MASIINGFTYDIFISYRQKDNKYDGWVTQFVDNLKRELEATFKEDISIYFDENPHDGLLETHNVDKSLEGKLECLIFIPVISQTYCDPKSFAWQNEFCAFNKMAKEDQFGRDIRLNGGNVASRILPVKINDLDPEDKTLLEDELGGVLRCIEFIYKSSGVNRPLRANEDHPQDNLNKTYYRDQINKVANAVKEIIKGLKYPGEKDQTERPKVVETKSRRQKSPWNKIAMLVSILIVMLIAGLLILPSVIRKFKVDASVIDKSVAVLTFKNLSDDVEQEYFRYGLEEEILDRICRISDLKVISHTSSERYKDTSLSLKEIAAELGVSAILEGTVLKMGNNVRITAKLINVKTNAYLWSKIFDEDFSDIFSIYRDVAKAVAKELRVTITRKERRLIARVPTTDMAAYDAYFKGKYYLRNLNGKDLEIAIQFFELAKKKDPEFALAYAGISLVWACRQQISISRPEEAAPKTEAAISRALELDSAQSDVQITLAGIKVWTRWDWKGGEASFRKAIELNPNYALAYNAYSHLLNILGRPDEAMNHIEIALQLDPLNPQIKAFYGVDLMFVHRYDDAVKAFQEALVLSPAHAVAFGKIVEALYWAGRVDEAIELLRIHQKDKPEYLKAIDEGYAEAGWTGAMKKLADLRAEKSKTIKIGSLLISNTYALAGDVDNAIYWLEKAFEGHSPGLPYLLMPTYDILRNDPRFQDLCRRMNLPYKLN